MMTMHWSALFFHPFESGFTHPARSTRFSSPAPPCVGEGDPEGVEGEVAARGVNEEDRASSPANLSHGHFPLPRFAVPLPREEAGEEMARQSRPV